MSPTHKFFYYLLPSINSFSTSLPVTKKKLGLNSFFIFLIFYIEKFDLDRHIKCHVIILWACLYFFVIWRSFFYSYYFCLCFRGMFHCWNGTFLLACIKSVSNVYVQQEQLLILLTNINTPTYPIFKLPSKTW